MLKSDRDTTDGREGFLSFRRVHNFQRLDVGVVPVSAPQPPLARGRGVWVRSVGVTAGRAASNLTREFFFFFGRDAAFSAFRPKRAAALEASTTTESSGRALRTRSAIVRPFAFGARLPSRFSSTRLRLHL